MRGRQQRAAIVIYEYTGIRRPKVYTEKHFKEDRNNCCILSKFSFYDTFFRLSVVEFLTD